MTTTSKPEAVPDSEVERLAHALISRGLLTHEEYQQCRATGEAAAGTDALLVQLVRAKLLTKAQARRARQEMAQLLKEQTQLPKEQIPGYKLLEKLGQGAMGVVHKARQLSMDRLVAVKLLAPRLAANDEFIKRFKREAHLAAK